MQMNSQAVAASMGITPRYVRKRTKAAVEAGVGFISLKGARFGYVLESSAAAMGKSYRYTRIEAPVGDGVKPKRRVPTHHGVKASDLPKIADASLKRFTLEEKRAVISFYHVSGVALGDIVKALIMAYGAAIKPSSLQAKIKRWSKDFRMHGGSALVDQRGGKAFKADLDLVRSAILGAGERHDTTLFGFYCYLHSEKHDLTHNFRKPKADVSESGFGRAVKHLLKVEPLLNEYLRLGMDAFIYAEPSFGRQWEYANQQWEIDATPLDLMVKVPTLNGFRDYMSRESYNPTTQEVVEFHLVRMQLIRVIDNFSGASVVGLYESSNSYANARLMYKAFKLLGMPETIKGDNGGDFVSAHLQGFFHDIGIEYIATGKARGDEKGMIERSFRSLQHSAAFEALPGFVGHCVAERQKLEGQASTKLEKLSGVATNIQAEFMWHWQADQWLENYLADKDADKYAMHDEQGLDDAALANVFRRLGKKSSRKVSKEGVRHRNTHFLSYEMWDTLTIGDAVTIQEHLDDSTTVFLYKDDADLGDPYLGELKDKNTFQKSQTVEELKATKKQYKQRISNKTKATAKAAQKGFGGYQNGMRDEFIELETAQAVTKEILAKEANDDDGIDAGAAYLAFALKAMG